MENFIRIATIMGLFAVLGFGLYWVREYREKTNDLNKLLASLAECNSEMKRTLLEGLVARFSSNQTDSDEISLDFQRFVARIMRLHYGGKTSVTRTNSDFGVDIQHWRKGKLYLGQVICQGQNEPVGYEPIAIIHSQILKQDAQGGFVATTSDFNTKAKQYAENLGIELINGAQLVDMWAASLRTNKKKPLEQEPKQA